MYKAKPNSARYQYTVPDTYPIIESLSIMADRTIVVRQKARNKLGFEIHFFNDRGEPKDVGMWFGDFFKILGIHGGFYYVASYDESEDLYGIVKVHKKDFTAYLKANPHSLDKHRPNPL